MIAKTILQKRVIELTDKLPLITQKQKDWGFKKLLKSYVIISRKKLFCLDCGESWSLENLKWHEEVTGVVCPCCNKKLEIISSGNSFSLNYMSILTTVKEFQVVRIVLLRKEFKKNTPANYITKEVIQHWIDPNGKITTVAIERNYRSYCVDQWYLGSQLSIKENVFAFNPEIYPLKKITPTIKRNGFKGNDYNLEPQRLFSNLLKNSKAETLLKSNQIELLKAFVKYESDMIFINENWNSIKLCIKNNYLISDFDIWRDYFNLLKYFNKDTNNIKFICPQNLKSSHDKLMIKKKEKLEVEDRLKQIERLAIEEKEYKLSKSNFFGIIFSNGNLQINVITKVEDFLKEGKILNHCIYTNNYYQKEDSLILSVKYLGEVIETVEIDLTSMSIRQSRGLNNTKSKYNKEIKELVNSNLKTISQIYQAA